MNRDWLRCVINDAACVVALVVVGTRNHDTDTGFGGVSYVAAPFLIGLLVAQVLMKTPNFKQFSFVGGLATAAITVSVGMVLRNLAFNRGTALAFVIVATVFLLTTMTGWRAFTMWRERRIAAAQQNAK
jgi:membrane protein DedA with SNARE-associated domain